MNNNTFNVIFCGTPEFAVPSLQALVQNRSFCVNAVVTQPDRPVGRKQVLTPSAVKQAAQAASIPIIQPEKLTAVHLENIPCDYLVVVAFGQLLSRSILQLPKIAAVNIHPSLLPRWRGATPIPATIASGDKLGGVTIQKMVYELDAGDILQQYQLPITSTTTSVQLYDTLFTKGAELLVQTLCNPLKPIAQEQAKVTHCGKLTRKDGELDPTMHTAEHIERLHRAYYPWPGITLQLPSGPLKLHAASLTPSSSAAVITCKQNTLLYADVVQEPSKQKIAGNVWQQKN